MGQQQPTKPQESPTFQKLTQYIKYIFSNQQQAFVPANIDQPIQSITQYLQNNLPAYMKQNKMHLDPVILTVFYQNNFAFNLEKLMKLLVQKLNDFNKRNLMLVKRQEFKFCLNLTNFLVFFTVQKISQTLQSFTIRIDLSMQTLRFIQKLQNENLKFSIHVLLDKLGPTQSELLHKTLESTLSNLINFKTKILTRSKETLNIIQRIQINLFMLFTQLLYSSHHSKALFNKIRTNESFKNHIKIGQYFLGKGCDQCWPSVYETAVLLLTSLMQKNIRLFQVSKQLQSLPSHLFKNIPIMIKNSVYQFITFICLYSLVQKKQGTYSYIRFTFNRISTLKLLFILINNLKITNPQITQLLQTLSLQTKIGSIQRAFVTNIIQKYYKSVKQKIKQNKKIEMARQKTAGFANKFLQKIRTTKTLQRPSQHISIYSNQTIKSDILQKYLQSGSQPFNIKYENKRYQIKMNYLLQEVQKDQNHQQNQFKILHEKFSYQHIMKRKVTYQYLDKVVWSKVLPKIIKQFNLIGKQIKSDDLESMNGPLRQKFVGSMPILMQKYIGDSLQMKSSYKSSFSSSAKNNSNLRSIQRFETQAQAMSNQMTEQAKGEQFIKQNKLKELIRQDPNKQKNKQPKENISLVFEEQNQIQQQFQTSQLEINAPKKTKHMRGQQSDKQVMKNKQIQISQ